MTEQDPLQAGIAAARSGDLERAQVLLAQAIRTEPNSEAAWLWLGKCLAEPDRREFCFRRVLTINPANEEAHRLLENQVEPADTFGAPPAEAPSEPASAFASPTPLPMLEPDETVVQARNAEVEDDGPAVGPARPDIAEDRPAELERTVIRARAVERPAGRTSQRSATPEQSLTRPPAGGAPPEPRPARPSTAAPQQATAAAVQAGTASLVQSVRERLDRLPLTPPERILVLGIAGLIVMLACGLCAAMVSRLFA